MATISSRITAMSITNMRIMIMPTIKIRTTIKSNISTTSNTNSQLMADTAIITLMKANIRHPLKISIQLNPERPWTIWTSSSLHLKRRNPSMMLYLRRNRLGYRLSAPLRPLQSPPRLQRRRQRSNAELVTTVTKMKVQTATTTTTPRKSSPLLKLNQLQLCKCLSSVAHPRPGQPLQPQ